MRRLACSSRRHADIIQLRLTLTIDPTVAQVDSNLKLLLFLRKKISRGATPIMIKVHPAAGEGLSSFLLTFAKNLTDVYDRDARKCP